MDINTKLWLMFCGPWVLLGVLAVILMLIERGPSTSTTSSSPPEEEKPSRWQLRDGELVDTEDSWTRMVRMNKEISEEERKLKDSEPWV